MRLSIDGPPARVVIQIRTNLPDGVTVSERWLRLRRLASRRSLADGSSLALEVASVLPSNAPSTLVYMFSHLDAWRLIYYVGVAGASAKSYLAEILAPQHRGLFMGILNSLCVSPYCS